MPYLKIWVHLVWSTKRRAPLLAKQLRYRLFNHIKANGKDKDIVVDSVNGYTDHIHCLVAINSFQSITTIVQLLKGESANWINENSLLQERFEWQDEYFAMSVSHSQLPAVRSYILNQDLLHKRKTFADEYDELLKKYEFDKKAS